MKTKVNQGNLSDEAFALYEKMANDTVNAAIAGATNDDIRAVLCTMLAIQIAKVVDSYDEIESTCKDVARNLKFQIDWNWERVTKLREFHDLSQHHDNVIDLSDQN